MASSDCTKSLQRHCIYSIANEFDRFCLAFSSTESNIPKHHFEFLQRKYTKDLLATLKSAKSLRNEHLDFIINRYTNEFDINQFEGCDWKCIEEKLLNVGDVMNHLTLSKELGSVNDDCGKIIDDLDWKKFPNLETVNLSNSSFHDKTLILISKCCPLLKILDVSYCVSITNEAFVRLSDSEDNGTKTYFYLKTLNVWFTCVNDEGISYILEHIPSLETIKHQELHEALYKRHIKHLETNCLSRVHKYNLTSLEFPHGCDSLTDVLSSCTILCPRLKNLTITVFTVEDLRLCSNFPELESVCFTGLRVRASDIQMISINSFLDKRGVNLITLDLCCFFISVSNLVKSCPNLRKLDLKWMNFESVNEWKIAPLKFLKSLCLEDIAFTDENSLKSLFSILSASCELEILQMPDCKFHIHSENKTLTNYMILLKEIDLSFTDIEVSFLKTIILSSTMLEKLTVVGCQYISVKQYDELSELIRTMKSNVKLIWSSSEPDGDFSDSDNDGFDYYDVYGGDKYNL